jgi:hypothetical protein
MTEQFKIGPDVIRTTAPPYFKTTQYLACVKCCSTKPKAMEKCIFSVAFTFLLFFVSAREKLSDGLLYLQQFKSKRQ